ncbi:MAG: hypothetical protein ABJC09_15745 [Terriglobia bacterium]
MSPGSLVPAATGTVKVTNDKNNGNMQFVLKVEHLAKPSALTPPATTYVVWVRARGGEALKQGALGVDKDLKGELRSVTVSKDFELFVTAEQSENATVPSGPEVLHTHINVT